LTVDHLQQREGHLGDRRPHWQGWPRPDGAGAGLGLS
jgi:hypothetical protein